MIVALYRWRVAAEAKAEFRAAWAELSDALLAHGSHGSALFTDADGDLVGIARWPDAATRASAFAAVDRPDLTERMRAFGERVDESVLEAVDVRWAPWPFPETQHA